jgi:hypothetical protein
MAIKMVMLKFENYHTKFNFFQNFGLQGLFHAGLIFIEPFVTKEHS